MSGEEKNKESYSGAFLLHPTPEQQFRPQLFVMEGDFFSLYPTVMIAHNLSPECIVEQAGDNTYAVDINFGIEGAKPEYVHFLKEPRGIVPRIL
jgi:DNA polymerase elongation subunit (family B)